MKKITQAWLCVLTLAGLLAGCAWPVAVSPAAAGSANEEATEAGETGDASEEDEENYETGDAALDDPLNGDDIGENELLVVSFGTSFNDSRRLTIGAIEKDLQQAFPDYSVRRAFTSQIIIDHVKKRDGEVIDNVSEALNRAMDNGVRNLVVQPTHLMHGYEYNDLVDEVDDYADAFDSIVISEPLLNTDEDYNKVIAAITKATAEYDDGKTAVCFMGHGTEASSNSVYAKMQDMIKAAGYDNYYIGTVEATPSLEDVVELVKQGSYEKAVLEPLMVVAGDHANNDMAGDEDDSWKSMFEAAGYETECIIRGLGELEDVRAIYVEHCREAIEKAGASNGDEKAAPALQENGENGPVTPEELKDGVYSISVDSSSSMFRITDCELTVKDGEMTALLTMGGHGYLFVYPGSAEEAEKASESEYIPFEENEKGEHTFTVKPEALDVPFELAAFSKNKQQWYDRTLVFESAGLSEDAFTEKNAKEDEDEDLKAFKALEDGTYSVKAELIGGSGKASVESPLTLTVKGGEVTARVVFSSPNYDYALVEGERYLPVNTGGNSAFEIPAKAPVIELTADTTAMSRPHEIEYSIVLDMKTIEKQSQT